MVYSQSRLSLSVSGPRRPVALVSKAMGAIRITTAKGQTTYESGEEAVQAYILASNRGERPVMTVNADYEEPDNPIPMTACD